MKWKIGLAHGALSAVLASIAGLVYQKLYSEAFVVDFSKVLGAGNLVFSTSVGCLLMALGYVLVFRWLGDKWIGGLNLVYAVLSFISIIGVLSFSLPLDMESPEMFPGLAIPLHFFPALAFTSVYPFFNYHNS